jgi:superfamily I DNA/RNA helicase
MTTLAITRGAAEWFLGKTGVLDQLVLALDDRVLPRRLAAADFAEGPLRLSATDDSSMLVLWHIDYLSGTGDEDWGFIILYGEYGVLEDHDIRHEVLERCLYVINQRLQGLFIEGAFIHRAHANGAHTCLAGRGTDARQLSIGYVEREVMTPSGSVHSLLCVGPAFDLARLASTAADKSQQLPGLVAAANAHLDPVRRRRVAPADLLPTFRSSLASYFDANQATELGQVRVVTGSHPVATRETIRTIGWTYDDWLNPRSSLSDVQRRLLESDALERHPIRIVGPGGSGKTLLMQLLALRQLDNARERARSVRILYLVHNAKMAESVQHRFSILQGLSHRFVADKRELHVQTLSEYGRRELGLLETQVIDPDAHEAKEFQFTIIDQSLSQILDEHASLIDRAPLLNEVRANPALRPILIRLLMAEISTAIKGHGLVNDEKRYVQSERRLSRLHGVMNPQERRIVFEVFRRYHSVVFDTFQVLDSDDIALSLLGRLRAPIWELKRRDLGYDFVFVDETQIFNENERRLLPLLTKSNNPRVPIVLALDEAQDIYGQSIAGLAALGIEDMASESLASIHRSTRAIIQLAFFVIQRSTDLFGADFPDYTGIADQMEPDDHPLAVPPVIHRVPDAQGKLSKYVIKRIRALRKGNLWRIGVVCYAEQYWSLLLSELRNSDLPLRVLESRGERLPASDPLVALTRPAYVGGQEFDAVLLVGLEEGLTPPRVHDNDALASAVEQQALREIYLGITRARFQLQIVLPADALPTRVLADAERAGLLGQNGAIEAA